MNPDQWRAIIIFGNAAMALVVSAWFVKLCIGLWPTISEALGY